MILAWSRVGLGQRAAGRRRVAAAQRQQGAHFLGERLAGERPVLAQRAAVRRRAGEQADRRRRAAVGHVDPLVGRRHPHRLRRALPHLPERRRRHAGRAVELAQRHPAPALAGMASPSRPGVLDHLAAHLVGQVDGLGGAGQVALIGEHVGRGGDVAHHRGRALVGAEVLRRHRVERGAELLGGAVHLARGEADPRLHERQLRVHRRGLPEAVHLGQRGARSCPTRRRRPPSRRGRGAWWAGSRPSSAPVASASARARRTAAARWCAVEQRAAVRASARANESGATSA